jgi:hypothetical protein
MRPISARKTPCTATYVWHILRGNKVSMSRLSLKPVVATSDTNTCDEPLLFPAFAAYFHLLIAFSAVEPLHLLVVRRHARQRQC